VLLGDVLHEGVIQLALKAREKYEAIAELVDVLVAGGSLAAELRLQAIDVVTKRERSMSTGMEGGVALPHGSMDGIDQMVASLGVSKAGIPFDSLDGKPCRLLVLMLLPRNNFKGYVSTLAGIAHLLHHPAFRQRLIEAPGAAAAIALIRQEEQRHGVAQRNGDG